MADISIHCVKQINGVHFSPDNSNAVSFTVLSGYNSRFEDEISLYGMTDDAARILHAALVMVEVMGSAE